MNRRAGLWAKGTRPGLRKIVLGVFWTRKFWEDRDSTSCGSNGNTFDQKNELRGEVKKVSH